MFNCTLYCPGPAPGCPGPAAALQTGLGRQHPVQQTLRGNQVVFVRWVPRQDPPRLLLHRLQDRYVRVSGHTVPLRGTETSFYT